MLPKRHVKSQQTFYQFIMSYADTEVRAARETHIRKVCFTPMTSASFPSATFASTIAALLAVIMTARAMGACEYLSFFA